MTLDYVQPDPSDLAEWRAACASAHFDAAPFVARFAVYQVDSPERAEQTGFPEGRWVLACELDVPKCPPEDRHMGHGSSLCGDSFRCLCGRHVFVSDATSDVVCETCDNVCLRRGRLATTIRSHAPVYDRCHEKERRMFELLAGLWEHELRERWTFAGARVRDPHASRGTRF